MNLEIFKTKINKRLTAPAHENNYFEIVKEILKLKEKNAASTSELETLLKETYEHIEAEIKKNKTRPISTVKFGTSGWRGIIGKDITQHTVQIVTLAIIQMYEQLKGSQVLSTDLGLHSLTEAQQKGVVVGHDNRFGGKLFAKTVCETLTNAGFKVYFGGEATTGTLSAAVLRLRAAFSINLTPSHNPLEYAGFKFNASDGGPASAQITEQITLNSKALFEANLPRNIQGNPSLQEDCDTLTFWQDLVEDNKHIHTIDPILISKKLHASTDFILAIDCVHGASRVQIKKLLAGLPTGQVVYFRDSQDVTFGGIAPEPSTKNLEMITDFLKSRPEKLKLGAILDPDGDRIRFTDGTTEINMNYFGAMAYHFLHEKRNLSGIVAKSVATSNLANKLANTFDEDIFEPQVGFKEFKPVVNSALVCFEESDGITITHHTPEKDGYIGLFLALAMIEETKQSLGDYYRSILDQYGAFFPDKDSVTVSEKGESLLQKLACLNKYTEGKTLKIGSTEKTISKAITIDGLKLVFDDQSWLLIRPSGTEPKVRFYVESRTAQGKNELFETARNLLKDIKLL